MLMVAPEPCWHPGCGALATAVDYIVNKNDGSSDLDSNFQAICKPCHTEKTGGEAARARLRR